MKINKNKKSKVIIAAIIVAVALGGAVFAYSASQNNDADKKAADKAKNENTVNKVDYGPATDEQKKAGDEQKKENQAQEHSDDVPATTKAEVVITDATQYDSVVEVRAYTPNVYEDGGTCTAVFKKSGATQVSVSHAAFRDASTTQCGALDIPRSSFGQSGEWSLVVTYNSATSNGSSPVKKVSIK